MKRYNMSIIDFSEIRHITTNKEILENAEKELLEREIISSSGNVNKTAIKEINKTYTDRFLTKLSKRLKGRENSFKVIYENLNMLNKSGEYTAIYFYIVYLYGFIEWRIPLEVNYISANFEALKEFSKQFLKHYKALLDEEKKNEDESK